MVYHRVHFKLTETQQKKLAHAHNNEIGAKLRLSKALVTPTGAPIMLTNHELEKLEDGNHHNITISSSRIKKMSGFLSFIVPALGGAAALTGIITSIVNAVKNSRSADAQEAAARATEEHARKQLSNE